jgi:hypothetical protein
MNRVIASARLHLLMPTRHLLLTWGILALALLASVALFASFGDDHDVVIVGGLFSLYITLFLSSVQAVTRVLPFALSLGVTRRAYYAGTCLFLAAQAAAAGIVLAGLRALEQGSDGWGTALRFFDVPFLIGGNPAAAAAGYAGSLALTCGVGLACGAVSRRWGGVGVTALSAAAFVAPSLVALWVVRAGWFPAIRDWFADQPELALQAAWPTVLAVALAGLGWVTVRRTPA